MRPHPEELAKQASRRMAARHGLAAILRDARKCALLRMRSSKQVSEHGRRLDPGLRNAAGALRAAPRRRCADPRASAVGMVRPRADAGRGHGARQYGPRSARPGARALFLRRQGRRQGQRRGQVRLSARRQAVPQSAAAGAAERRFRPHHGAAVLLCRVRRSLLARDDEIERSRRWRRSRPSPKRKAPIICGIPRNGSSGSATAPRKATAARRPRSTISGPIPARCLRSTTASAA